MGNDRRPPFDLSVPEGHDGRELSLSEREERQRDAVKSECDRAEAHRLRRVSRGTLSLDVVLPGPEGSERVNPFELLERLDRVLVVAGRGAGKTTFVQLLAAHIARRAFDDRERLPLLAPAALLAEPRLDIRELARLNPAAGEACVRRALADGRAIVFIDGLDEATEPGALKYSIAALAAARPRAAFVATTRPLPPKVAGISESALPGFAPLRFAPPLLPVTPAYELEARRHPAARVRLLGAEVERRLEAWKHGALLGRMTDEERLTVAVGVAVHMHHARALECPIEGLARRLSDDLPALRWSEGEQRYFMTTEEVPDDRLCPSFAPLIEDIRAHAGLMVEKRPGVLAFADLAFQEYLAAIGCTSKERATERRTYELFDHRLDPWWYEVLVCAAGLPARLTTRLSPAELVRTLLEEDLAAGSTTTFLAARMAVVVPDLPRGLRGTIERRVRATVPPRSSVQVWHLVDDVGDIAGQALVKALDSAGADERAYIATTLGRLDHAPALRALARLSEDQERTTEPILCWAWNVDVEVVRGPVAFFAFAALFNLAISNPTASAVFDDVLARVSLDVFDVFFRVVANKLAADDYWGNEPVPERDPDRIADMLESIRKASSRRGHGGPKSKPS